MFLTFEGIDGAGKSTQIRLLKDYFEAQGREVIILREPGGTGFSEKIRDLLLSNDHNIGPVAELFLFEAARNVLVEKIIQPNLKEGKVVLCDRFFDSTTSYQGYGRELPLEKVKELNLFATDGLEPDLTIYLHLPLEVARERSGKIKDRMEKSGDDFFRRVIKGFEEIAENNKRVIKIDATQRIDETFEKILDALKKHIKD